MRPDRIGPMHWRIRRIDLPRSQRRWRYCLLLLSVAVACPAAGGKDGAARHLFVDDFFIESMAGLTRATHQPQRHPGNPILTGSSPWEHWSVEVNGRPVLYDEERRKFRMWYGSPRVQDNAPQKIRYRVCYGESTDGVHWEKPILRQVEWEGSRENNLLRWGENWMRRPNVMRDDHDQDPSRRFKMTYADVIGGRTAVAKAYSPDGIRWRTNGDGQPWFRHGHNSNLLGWDPYIERYVLYPRMSCSPCAVGRSTSKDFVTWTDPETVMAPPPEESDKDFKGLAAFFYADQYLGFVWVFHRDAAAKTTSFLEADVELASSRDGAHWTRVAPGKSFFDVGAPGTWDREGLILVAPVAHGDRIWLYYTGWNFPYGQKDALRRTQEGWVENGQRIQYAIGLATLRLDGFVSLDAGRQPGTITTRPLTAKGEMYVNADVKGELRVELLDRDNRPIPGYSAADCEPIRSDGLRHRVRWQGKRPPPREAKARFLLREGSLYSFWFQS